MENNIFCHFEWAVSNLDKAKGFYGGMFNWTFDAMGEEYATIKTGNAELGGGLMKTDKVNPGESPVMYILVNSIEEKLALVIKLGGSVCVPKTVLPEMGWFAVVGDLDKNPVGLFESSKKA